LGIIWKPIGTTDCSLCALHWCAVGTGRHDEEREKNDFWELNHAYGEAASAPRSG